jgi:hypothetical protein
MPRICLRDSRLWSLPLLILALLLQFAAPAAAQYHQGWHRNPDSKEYQEQNYTSQKEAYEKYKLKKEQMNLEREKKGLEPRPIATFEEWKRGIR